MIMKGIDLRNLDKKSKIELAITSAAVIILIIVLSNSIKSLLRARKKPAAAPVIEAATIREMVGSITISKRAHGKDAERREKILDDGRAWGRDPFLPWDFMGSLDAALFDIKLEGIMWDENNPNAVINGGIYEKGDNIGNMTILKIDKQSIVVSDGNKEYTIRLR